MLLQPDGLFFLQRAEEGGRWIELCHVADKFPLASSPCASPPASPPHARGVGCFFFPCIFFLLLFCLVFFHPKEPTFPRFTSQL